MHDKKNINQATKEDLMNESRELGNELAERIENFIHEQGGIKEMQELNKVSNVGEETIASLKEKFTVK